MADSTLLQALAHAPWGRALAGGALIGLASGVLMLGLGRIAGISGIFHLVADPTLQPPHGERAWRWAFLLGMAGMGLLMAQWLPQQAAAATGVAHLPWMVAGGLLVGWGTRLGSGCTSGHGVCGLARLSPRSLVAVATFLATGMLTTYAMRHFGS